MICGAITLGYISFGTVLFAYACLRNVAETCLSAFCVGAVNCKGGVDKDGDGYVEGSSCVVTDNCEGGVGLKRNLDAKIDYILLLLIMFVLTVLVV